MNRGDWPGGKAPLGTRAVQLKESDIYYSPFLDLYGRPNRFSVEVDDFRSTNPASHPKLLRRLAEDFARNGYKLKRLIRLIATSRTYQLSSATNETNAADRINYSHALPRPLDAEILLEEQHRHPAKKTAPSPQTPRPRAGLRVRARTLA